MMLASEIYNAGMSSGHDNSAGRCSTDLSPDVPQSASSTYPSTSSDELSSAHDSDECTDDAEHHAVGVVRKISTKTSSLHAVDEEYHHECVYCEIPDGVEIRPNAYGHGIFVTKPFHAGEIIYTGHSIMVPDKPGKIPLKTSHGGEYLLDVQTHTVKQWDDNMRQLYAFDSFMNHSCDPTSESILLTKDSVEQTYHQVAIKDLLPGQEVTCDYTLFEYDCPDKAIYQCACGSESCLGTVLGFKYLTEAEKLQRLPKTDGCVIEAWLADNPDLAYFDLRSMIPNGINVIHAGYNAQGRPMFKMLATRAFTAGETIFANESQYFDEHKQLVVTVDNISVALNPIDHTVNRGDGQREFFGFDSFMNHSCSPNSDMVYGTTTAYIATAHRDIAAGEEITCDYETFDDCLDGSVFECWCGAPNCRKFIRG